MGGIDEEIENDLVDIAGIADHGGQIFIELEGNVGHIFPLVAGDGDGGLDGFVEIGRGLIGRVGVGELLHGANDFGDPVGALQTLLDGARHLGQNELQIALPLGFLERGGHAHGQRVGGAAHGLAILFQQVASRLPGFAQEGEVIADKLGGGINLVGDAGGELADAFELVRLAETAFHLAPLGDVADEGEGVFLPIELQVVDGDIHGKDAAIFVLVAAFKVHRALRLDVFPDLFSSLFGEKRIEIGDGERTEFLARPADGAAGGRVGIDDAALGIGPEDGIGGALERSFGQEEFFFGEFSFGDVAKGPNPPVIFAALIHHGSGIAIHEASVVEFDFVAADGVGIFIELVHLGPERVAVPDQGGEVFEHTAVVGVGGNFRGNFE